MPEPQPLCANRREWLAAGFSGLVGGLALSTLARGATTDASVPTTGSATFGRAKSCILVYLLGGPPHLDMWDLKPEAPAEIRGPFRPISTALPGLAICEHLPRLARQAQRYALVRSVTHPNDFHTHMIYYTLTGRHMDNPNANDNVPKSPARGDHPHFGSIVAKYQRRASRLPGYVALPALSIRMQPVPLPGGDAGFLGPRFDPLAIADDPRKPDLAAVFAPPRDVPPERFAARQAMLATIDGRGPRAAPVAEYDVLRETAARMVGSRASRLFLLEDEPMALRERYGEHRFGQSLLLARRLVEAGVAVVAVHFNFMTKCDGWDTHQKNFEALQDELLPLLDQGLSALFDDLDARGRLDETLVVTMGEFGRTPRINANAGRDHWGRCASVVLAGGGIRGGQVIGASDKIGAYPADRPIDPTDIHATLYHCLGMDRRLTMHDQLARPVALCTGTPIVELI